MCPYISNVKKEPEKSQYIIGFPKGVNSIQDRTLISDKQLIQGDNIQIEVDGVSRRPGSTKVFNESGTKVLGSSPFYIRTTGTRYFIRAVKTGTNTAKLQYLNGTTWTDISGGTLTASNPVSFVQARNKLFVYNGKDALRYLDTSLALTTYTALTTPTGLGVTATGATGSTVYSYRVNAFNETGSTAACTRVQISDGNATLSTTNYNALSWDAVSGADGYNIYGRTPYGYQEVYLATVYGVVAYNDTGSASPLTSVLAPDINNSGGLIAKFGLFSLGRQYVACPTEGGTYYPTRLYYSGVLDYVETFSGGEYGGGWVEVSSNDGGEIVGLAQYQNGIIVFKTNGIFKFYFTSTGLPAIQEITRENGGVSFNAIRSIGNNVAYVGQKEEKICVYTLGQQENYTGELLRTNEVSIFISSELEDVNRTYLTNIAAFYYDDNFAFTYTTEGETENSNMWLIDTAFGGWVHWTGLPTQATHYTIYDDGTDAYLYGGSNSDGYMIRLFEDDTNDNDVAFKSVVGTKFFNGNQFDIEKVWRNPILWFKYINAGSVDCEIWADGTRKIGTAELASVSSGGLVGIDLFGTAKFGHTVSSIPETTIYADIPKQLDMMTISKSIGFFLIDEAKNTDWLFMGLRLLYTTLEGKPLPSQHRVVVT